MPRWIFFAPLIGLIAATAVIGLSLGRKAATTTETATIERMAARYVVDAGGAARITDCTARPAVSAQLWLVVTCTPPGGPGAFEYFVDRFGALEHRSVP